MTFNYLVFFSPIDLPNYWQVIVLNINLIASPQNYHSINYQAIILHCLWSKTQTLKSTTVTTITWSYFSSMPHFSLMHTSNWSTHFSSSHHISSPFTLLLTSDLSILLPSPHTDVLQPLLIESLFLIWEYLIFNAHMHCLLLS